MADGRRLPDVGAIPIADKLLGLDAAGTAGLLSTTVLSAQLGIPRNVRITRESVAALEADTLISQSAGATDYAPDGTLVAAGRSLFMVDSTATTGYVENANGVKFKVLANEGGYYPFWSMNPESGGVTDVTSKLQQLMDIASANGGGAILIPPEIYRVEGLNYKTGVKLVGAGFERNVGASGAAKGGTRFVRTSAVRIINAIGVGKRDAAGHAPISYGWLQGIMFDGAGYAADIIAMHACVTWTIFDCMFTDCEGARWIDMREVWDSHFSFCRFERGGSADGTVPGLPLISGGPWERTNQIHFHSSVFENFPGLAIDTPSLEEDYFTNEIYFTSTKIETQQASTQPLVRFDAARTVVLNGLNVSAKGQAGTAIVAPVQITNCRGVQGSLQIEFIAGGADWGAFVDITGSSSIDLNIREGGAYEPTEGVVVKTDGANVETMHFRAVGDFTDRMANQPSRIGDSAMLYSKSGEPQLQFKRGDIADSWSLGRLVADGGGTKFRVLHGATETLRIQNNNVVAASYMMTADTALLLPSYTVATVPDATISAGMQIFVTDEVGGAVPAFSSGGNWRRTTDRAIIST